MSRGEDEPTLRGIAADGVKRALARGAERAEVYVVTSATTTITSFGAYVAPHETMREGIAVRVLRDGRVGQSGTSGFHRLDEAVAAAVSAAAGDGAAQARLALAPPLASQPAPAADGVLDSGDADRMSSIVERASERMRGQPDVTYARALLAATRWRYGVANSEGLETSHSYANEMLELELRVTRATAERTALNSWNGARAVETAADPDAMVDDAVAQARAALDPTPLTRPVNEVILGAVPASQVVGIFAGSLSGVGEAAGKSALAGRIGERVVSEHLTLQDLPHDPSGRSRRFLDDEGTPTRPTTFIENGTLRTFAHTLASAEAAGVEPAGHGLRKDVQSSVTARPVNLVVRRGDQTLAELIEGADRAVVINQPLLGSFAASRVTGDFSLVVPFAFYVEGGRIRHSLPPTAVGGNAHRVLESVAAVGREARNCRAGVVPPLRAGGVSCAT